jgi:hypothetical protein
MTALGDDDRPFLVAILIRSHGNFIGHNSAAAKHARHGAWK